VAKANERMSESECVDAPTTHEQSEGDAISDPSFNTRQQLIIQTGILNQATVSASLIVFVGATH
jgi:hypothetical protein